jgi:hypothetical protein
VTVKKRRLELPDGFWEDNETHLRKLQERIDYHARKLAEERATREKRQG